MSLINQILDFITKRPIKSIEFIKKQIIPFYSEIHYHSKNIINSLITFIQYLFNEKKYNAPILKNLMELNSFLILVSIHKYY